MKKYSIASSSDKIKNRPKNHLFDRTVTKEPQIIPMLVEEVDKNFPSLVRVKTWSNMPVLLLALLACKLCSFHFPENSNDCGTEQAFVASETFISGLLYSFMVENDVA